MTGLRTSIGVCGLVLLSAATVTAQEQQKEKPAAAKPAPAGPQSFEEAASNARPIKNVAALFDVLFDECKDGDDLTQRQCRTVRDWSLSNVRNEHFISLGDWGSLRWTPYSPVDKEISLEVQGCLACEKPATIGGKPRYVTSRPPKNIKAGKASGVEVGYYGVPIAAEEAKQWEQEIARRLRVQYVYLLGAPWKTSQGEGASFKQIAYRVFDPCTGKVVTSVPPSTADAPILPDAATCPASTEKKEIQEPTTDTLTRTQVERSLVKAKKQISDCYQEFGYSGPVNVKLIVAGSGHIVSTQILPPHDRGDLSLCVRAALKDVTMPRFDGDRLTITYPFMR